MDEEKEKEEKIERLPSLMTAQMLEKDESVFFNVARFEHAQRVAKLLSETDLLPEHFRKNVPNCFIVLNLAVRMNIDPFMLAQSMYVVKGRPGFEAKLLIALLQSGGRFGPLYYKFEGSGKTRSCMAYAKDLKTGQVIEGPPVTWEMVSAEGWDKPRGERQMKSKWETMPDLMFRYRSAAFFARVYDPGALMGMHTLDELEDQEIEIKVGEGRIPSSEPPQRPGPSEEEVIRSRKALMAGCPPKIEEAFTQDDFDEFLVLTASGLRKSVNETIIEASEDAKEFWRAFAKWAAKTKKVAKKEEPKTDPPAGQEPATNGKPPEQAVEGAGATAGDPPVQNEKKEPENEKKAEPPSAPKVSALKILTEKYHKDPKLYYAALSAVGKKQVLDDKDAELVLKKMEELEATKK